MKITAIRGQGLASLVDPFEIPLEHGPLAQAGLFSISGPTGAGKSTILDAMCLALFGKTPRMRGRSRVKVGTHDPLSDRDARSLLSRSCAAGFAEVEFVGVDRALYRARWSVRRARRSLSGRIQPATQDLERVADGVSLSSHAPTQTLQAISERLGLSFAQFCRSVLLAQGEFSAFLRAEDKERADLLERMTGTEIYRRLSIACHLQHRSVQAERQAALGAVEQFEVWDEATCEQWAKRQAQAQAVLATCTTAVEQARAIQQACVRRAEALQQLERAQAQATRDARAWTDSQDKRTRFECAQKVRAVQGLYERVRSLAIRVEQQARVLEDLDRQRPRLETVHLEAQRAQRVCERALQTHLEAQELVEPEIARAQALDAQCAELQPAIERGKPKVQDRQARIVSLDEGIERHRARLKEIRAQEACAQETWGDLSVLDRLHTRRDELRACAKRFAALEGPNLQADKDLQAAQKELRRLQEGLEALRAESRALRARQTGLGMDSDAYEPSIDPELLALQDWAPRLQSGRGSARAVQRELEELRVQAQRRQALLEQEQRMRAQLEVNARALEALQAEHEVLEHRRAQTHERQRFAREQSAMQDHRHALRPGQACPLCGSTQHPYQAGAPTHASQPLVALQQQLDSLDQERESLAAKRSELDRTQAELQVQLAGIPDTQRLLESEGDALLARANREEQSLWSALDPAQIPSSCSALVAQLDRISMSERLDPVNAERAAAQRCATLDKLVERVDATVRDLRNKQSELALQREQDRAARVALERLAQRERVLFDQLQTAQLETHRSHERKLRAQEALHSAKNQLAEMMAGVKGLCFASASQGDARVESSSGQTLDQWLQALVKAVADQGQRAAAASKLQAELQVFERELAGARARHLEALEQLASLEAQHLQLSRRRAQLLHGQPVRDYVATQRDRERQLREDLKLAQTKTQEAHAACLEQTMRAKTLQEQQRLSVADQRTGQAQLSAEYERLDLQPEHAVQMFAMQDTQLDQIKRELDALKRAHETSRALVDSRSRDLASLVSTWPALPESEHAVAKLEQAEAALAAAQKTGLEIDTAIAGNAAANEQRAQRVQAHAELLEKARRWGQLHTLIGHGEGTTFQRFAQGLSLDRLLMLANHHLQEIDGRYRLARVPGGSLDLQVVDALLGDEVRSIHSLSGGESFLVSLALALGLSSLSSTHTRVESLFIDEGFGTLDRDSLDQVLSALDALQATGRQVGLISHVDGLSEQLGAQVRVQPCGHGKSRVQVQDGATL